LGGNIELLDRGKNGLLIPVEDAETAAAQVLAYIEDQALQQAHIARSHQRLATIFNPERFEEAIRAVVNPYL
jgi:glycosyltransferase involved in cell wall biosynthesis